MLRFSPGSQHSSSVHTSSAHTVVTALAVVVHAVAVPAVSRCEAQVSENIPGYCCGVAAKGVGGCRKEQARACVCVLVSLCVYFPLAATALASGPMKRCQL